MVADLSDDAEVISLGPCSACGERPSAPDNQKPVWASLAGWDSCVDWGYDGMDFPPIVGECRNVSLSHPFLGKLGEPFWCHWVPWSTWDNGFEEHPEDLARGCLVQAKLMETGEAISPLASEKVIRGIVEILQCRPYLDFLNDAAFDGSQTRLGESEGFPKLTAQFEQFFFADVNFQSDIGEWAIWIEDEQFRHVLVYGVWDRHTDCLFAGHFVQKIPARKT